MLKAIVSSLEELDSLAEAKGYHPTFDEGDEATVGGTRLLCIGGKWVDKEEHDKKLTEKAEELMKSLQDKDN